MEKELKELFGAYLEEYYERGKNVRFVINSQTVVDGELRHVLDMFAKVSMQLGDEGRFYFHCTLDN